ncbi:pyrroline-5-carboxylate reductase [Thalassotalea aquiviva]|uniref:pyrroline-5-carboxylate reductase n=1 Tax=Thalassotalea aquiviva TaxID=3242415 RepID=UPI00352A42E4
MKRVAFIGAGNMSRCILVGMVNNGFDPNSIIVSNPSAPKRLALQQQYGVLQTDDNIEAATFADVIFLSVKPHLIKQVCAQIKSAMDIRHKCFISVAAGVSLEQMHSVLGQEAHIIRCMPNTPSQLGFGMSGMYAPSHIDADYKAFADQALSSVGKVLWLETEDKIDDLITVSGSGPAYFFAFMEAMQQQAIRFGFDPKTARTLVEQTALGAAQMVVQNSDEIATLRENVTSKGGTTQAALNQFEQGGLAELVTQAMEKCKARAKEMTQSNNS